jgi:hypothetical protein
MGKQLLSRKPEITESQKKKNFRIATYAKEHEIRDNSMFSLSMGVAGYPLASLISDDSYLIDNLSLSRQSFLFVSVAILELFPIRVHPCYFFLCAPLCILSVLCGSVVSAHQLAVRVLFQV